MIWTFTSPVELAAQLCGPRAALRAPAAVLLSHPRRLLLAEPAVEHRLHPIWKLISFVSASASVSLLTGNHLGVTQSSVA